MSKNEYDAWQDTLVKISNDNCPKCGSVNTKENRKVEYNMHKGQGDYCTYDKHCTVCGYLIISLLD